MGNEHSRGPRVECLQYVVGLCGRDPDEHVHPRGFRREHTRPTQIGRTGRVRRRGWRGWATRDRTVARDLATPAGQRSDGRGVEDRFLLLGSGGLDAGRDGAGHEGHGDDLREDPVKAVQGLLDTVGVAKDRNHDGEADGAAELSSWY